MRRAWTCIGLVLMSAIGAGCGDFKIRVSSAPQSVVANAPPQLFEILIDDGEDLAFPITVEFRSGPNCASEDWFDCGTTEQDGVVRSTVLQEGDLTDDSVIVTEFLECHIEGGAPGTSVTVSATLYVVDANGEESNGVDVSYTCVVE